MREEEPKEGASYWEPRPSVPAAGEGRAAYDEDEAVRDDDAASLLASRLFAPLAAAVDEFSAMALPSRLAREWLPKLAAQISISYLAYGRLVLRETESGGGAKVAKAEAKAEAALRRGSPAGKGRADPKSPAKPGRAVAAHNGGGGKSRGAAGDGGDDEVAGRPARCHRTPNAGGQGCSRPRRGGSAASAGGRRRSTRRGRT